MKTLRIIARILAGILVLGSLLMVVVTRPWIGLSSTEDPPAFHWLSLLSFVPTLVVVWSFAVVLLLLAQIDERLGRLQIAKGV